MKSRAVLAVIVSLELTAVILAALLVVAFSYARPIVVHSRPPLIHLI